MKKWFSCLLPPAIVMCLSVSCNNNGADFVFRQSEQGFELTEGENPVLSYQRVPKTLSGEYFCNNYLHPLYNLDGDVLTEEFPADHTYHRGVFWSWHQLYSDTISLGDGWINDGITLNVVDVLTETRNNTAEIKLDVNWFSNKMPENEPFMHERTVIVVHKADSDTRSIDFTIELSPLIDKFTLGGSDDPKGYGGFCLRLDIPDDMVFTSEDGQVQPHELQVSAGRWMDFSGSFGKNSEQNGVAILCHKDNPVFPSPWILRQKGSMQNAVYPGRERVTIERDKPLVLKYRLVIHRGGLTKHNMDQLQAEYSGY